MILIINTHNYIYIYIYTLSTSTLILSPSISPVRMFWQETSLDVSLIFAQAVSSVTVAFIFAKTFVIS